MNSILFRGNRDETKHVTQGTVLCVDKNKQNLLKYCRGANQSGDGSMIDA